MKRLPIKETHKGILYIILSAFCFALMSTCVRMAGDLPSVQKSFFRNLVAVFFALFVLLKDKKNFIIPKGNLKYLLLRSICGTLGILCNFYAIDHLVLSDASMLNKMSPFFAILFSYLLLKEKLDPVQLIAVILAFLGSLLIIKPSFQSIVCLPALIGLLGGIGAGAAYTFVRILGQRGQKGPFVVFFFSAFSCLFCLPFVLLSYTPMTLRQLLILLGAGLAASGGQFAITAAYFHAPAKEISVYDYSQILFAALLGFFLFDQVPDHLSIAGYIIILSMAVWTFLHNKKLRT
ncbi:MAG: DMT family transporter [Clostridiales bacterium]|nr:DMT family transporter [Clostridiales bacterium]